MAEVRHSEAVGAYDLSIVKWADRQDNVLAVVWASVGLGVAIASNGWFGWGPDLDEARWLVQLRDRRTSDVRTVATALTLRGARRRARRIRSLLSSGDEAAIHALPDVVF